MKIAILGSGGREHAIAYAISQGVTNLHLYGLDYTHKAINFAEAGKACCEFWLAIAISKGIKVNIAHNSSLLDTNIPDDKKAICNTVLTTSVKDAWKAKLIADNTP